MTGGKIHRLLAGYDGPGRRALPLGELLHPVPLAALAMLVINDHVLKGSGAPEQITGKLSDVAGLIFFPLLCTALGDLLLLVAARIGAPVDFSLRHYKLVTTIAFTAALFSSINVSPACAQFLEDLLGAVGFASHITVDPTDLATLPALGVAYLIGHGEISRVPLGRLEVMERAWRRNSHDLAAHLADTRASKEQVRALADTYAHFLETGDPKAAEAALTSIRAPTAAPARHP